MSLKNYISLILAKQILIVIVKLLPPASNQVGALQYIVLIPNDGWRKSML